MVTIITNSITSQDFDPYVCPGIALKKIKFADSISQTLYVFGAAGFGKTSLIKYYFRNKEYEYYSAEKVTAEELKTADETKWKKGARRVVVIDDLSYISNNPNEGQVKNTINQLASKQNIWLILIGRGNIGSWLQPIHLTKFFEIIDEEDLTLRSNELAKYFSLWGITMTQKELGMLEVSIGCPGVGVIARICAMTYRPGEELTPELIEKIRNDFWDYLEYHVYSTWDVNIQEFFMKMSIVDSFDIRLAEMITGRTDIAGMILHAKEIGNFITAKSFCLEEERYELRTAFRRSMKRRLYQQYNNEQRSILYNNAGLYYELNHLPMKALEMYEACNDIEHILNLLLLNSRENPGSGYFYELKKYYFAIPEERICTKPELMAGMSMLQSLVMNVDESERWYTKLKEYTESQSGSLRKISNSWLLYLEIALPHRGSLNLIKIFKNTAILFTNRQITLPEFSVTSNLPSMMNGGKDFCEWSKRDKELAATIGKAIELILGKYGKGLVNLALAESYFEKGTENLEVAMLANRGKMQAEAGGKIEQCFVATGILAWLQVISQHAPEALEQVTSFYEHAKKEGASKLLPNIEALITRMNLYLGNLSETEAWMKDAPSEDNEFCIMDRFKYLTKVRVYLLNGENEQAYHLLQKLLYYSEVMQRIFVRIESKLLCAVTLYRMKNPTWDNIMCEALTEAEEYHFVRIISREGMAVIRLLHETSWKPQDEAFFKQVISETNKVAQSYPGYLKVIKQDIELCENALQILRLQAEGYSIAEIAEIMHLQEETVKYHNKQTYKKLGVSGKTGAVMEAKKRNLI